MLSKRFCLLAWWNGAMREDANTDNPIPIPSIKTKRSEKKAVDYLNRLSMYIISIYLFIYFHLTTYVYKIFYLSL